MSTEPEPSTDSIRTGKTVGSWYLERYAGHGSYGLVYKARHVSRPDSVKLGLLALAPFLSSHVRRGFPMALDLPPDPRFFVLEAELRHNTRAARTSSRVYSRPTVSKGPVFWMSHAREPGGM
jgi:hypothetical protein